MQTPRPNVLDRRVDLLGQQRQFVDRGVVEIEGNPLGREQCFVLFDQACFRLDEDAPEVVAVERLQFDPDRQSALQFRQQIGRLGLVEGTRSDEQDMVGLDRPVLRRDRGAFDQWQEVALHPFAADIGTAAAGAFAAPADLVDFVDEDDAVLLGRGGRFAHHHLLVQ